MLTRERVKQILGDITMENTSCMAIGGWDIEERYKAVHGSPSNPFNPVVLLSDFAIRVTYMRPDTATGKIEQGFSGPQLVSVNIPPDEEETVVVKRAWLCISTCLEHEAREAFRYHGVRVFDPHKLVCDLQYGYCGEHE